MKCFFGGAGMRSEFLEEENALLRSRLEEEHRSRLYLQQQLQEEQQKCTMLEKEIGHAQQAALEMGDCLKLYFSGLSSSTDTRISHDQSASVNGGMALEAAPFAASSAALGPGNTTSRCSSPRADLGLQRRQHSEQLQSHMLDLAEQLQGLAASWQHRLVLADAGNAADTPQHVALLAAAGPAVLPTASVASSISAASEAPGSVNLPMQALALSRLAFQLTQSSTQAPAGGDQTSFYSSSCNKSSCTVLGAGSIDLTSSLASFHSRCSSHQPLAQLPNAVKGPMADGSAQDQQQQQLVVHQPRSDGATRCAITRGAAAIAGSCASIAAAAAATAAATAARKSAVASSLISNSGGVVPGMPPAAAATSAAGVQAAGPRQRQRWTPAQEHWQQQQQQEQQYEPELDVYGLRSRTMSPDSALSMGSSLQYHGAAAPSDGTGAGPDGLRVPSRQLVHYDHQQREQQQMHIASSRSAWSSQNGSGYSAVASPAAAAAAAAVSQGHLMLRAGAGGAAASSTAAGECVGPLRRGHCNLGSSQATFKSSVYGGSTVTSPRQ